MRISPEMNLLRIADFVTGITKGVLAWPITMFFAAFLFVAGLVIVVTTLHIDTAVGVLVCGSGVGLYFAIRKYAPGDW